MTATNPTNALGMQNWFATTLSQSCGSTDTTLYLTVTPTPTEGYLVIDPNNTSTREVIHYTSVGAGTVTLPGTGDRGLDGTSAATHAQGTDVELHYTTSYFTALQSGDVWSANAIATTGLFSSSIFANAVVSLANTGTAGGTIHYLNMGGLKFLWCLTALVTSYNTPQWIINLPSNFFNNILSITGNSTDMSTDVNQSIQVGTVTATTVPIVFSSGNNSAGAKQEAYISMIGN